MKEALNELALFAGIGGGILGGSLLGWRTVCAVEKESYCREVLLRRQRDGLLPLFPIWDDVKTFDGRPWRGKVDVISGGFPCQDISCAGKGEGITGARSGLWEEMARIIGEVRPRYVFVENSPLLVSRGLTTVLSDFTKMGYDAEWCPLSAAECGADHKRNRIWILANAIGEKLWNESGWIGGKDGQNSAESANHGEEKSLADSDEFYGDHGGYGASTVCGERSKTSELQGSEHDVANAYEIRRTGRPGEIEIEKRRRQSANCSSWPTEPNVGRVANGIPNRVDRLKAIGNAQVPIVAATAWRILNEQ